MTSGCLRGVVFGVLLSLSAGVAAQTPVRLASYEYPSLCCSGRWPKPAAFPPIWSVKPSRGWGGGVSIEFYPWNRGVKLLEAGAVDGLFTIKKTPERMTRFNYPNKPLILQDYVFFVRKGTRTRFAGRLRGFLRGDDRGCDGRFLRPSASMMRRREGLSESSKRQLPTNSSSGCWLEVGSMR